MIQLIATDMDGTLLDEEKQLPAQLPALLEEYIAAILHLPWQAADRT